MYNIKIGGIIKIRSIIFIAFIFFIITSFSAKNVHAQYIQTYPQSGKIIPGQLITIQVTLPSTDPNPANYI
ncbi:MAG: hypothetical protein ACP5RI_03435, partial [Candidatus Micrarchaeia archaeon]